jgi:GT2 family glycosyltransferase
MKPITFCIPTAKNEKEYVKLLIKSLQDNTEINLHEILVFIDSDNQGTYEFLSELKNTLPNLKIYKNENEYPVGGQRNISIMFNAASNDIVCYLQSDMVVGLNFDKHISENLVDDGTILSCTRIEPPLHPESPEKIVKNFGITTEEFKYSEFLEFVKDLQLKNKPNTEGYFAPFALYKNTWFDKLGGFDTQFRCSREDSDLIIRMGICNLKMIQSWKACVYHFTCVSSRGKEWFRKTKEANYANDLQSKADVQELKRFIRKWGFFGHYSRPLYDVTLNINLNQYIDFNALKAIEPYCTRLNLSDANVANELSNQLEFEAHYYSNLRWNYTFEYWNSVKHLFNPTDFSKRITSLDTPTGDVIVNMEYSSLIEHWASAVSFLENIHQLIDSTEVGVYGGEFFTIEINNKRNLVESYTKQPHIELILDTQTFKFI